MKKTVIIVIILMLILLTAFCLPGYRTRPAWSDIYYKKAAIARGWKYIIIHHSATNSGSAKAFHKYHTQQGYGGLSYHFVIGNGKGAPDGKVEEGFRWKEQISGTHVDVNSWYHNVFGIGICLVGNFNTHSPTRKQMTALKELVTSLSEKYRIPAEKILGHSQVPFGTMDWGSEKISVFYEKGKTAQTYCPGKKFPDLSILHSGSL